MKNLIEIRQTALNGEQRDLLRSLGFILSFVKYEIQMNAVNLIYSISVK